MKMFVEQNNEGLGTSDPSMAPMYHIPPADKIPVGTPNLQSVVRDSLQDVTPQKPSDANQPLTNSKNKRSGRWTLDEKILFLYGLRRFGKGRWKKISIYLPDRYV